MCIYICVCVYACIPTDPNRRNQVRVIDYFIDPSKTVFVDLLLRRMNVYIHVCHLLVENGIESTKAEDLPAKVLQPNSTERHRPRGDCC